MVKQLLVTIAVALVVIMIARMKRGREGAGRSESGSSGNQPISATALAGYALAAVMIITAGTLTWMGWQQRNEIIEIVVIDARTGDRTVYSVRRKALGEREFRTIDGRYISLGSADRMERVE